MKKIILIIAVAIFFGGGLFLLKNVQNIWFCENGSWFKQVNPIEPVLDQLAEVFVFQPQPNQEIESPLTVTGQARGFWFFEADMPIKILDQNQNLISQSFVTAQQDWMTEDFVEFEGQIEFLVTEAQLGFLVVEKDNPSGLPQYDDRILIPVKLLKSSL